MVAGNVRAVADDAVGRPAALTVTGGSRLATPDWFPPLSVQWNVTTTSWFVQVPAA